MTDELVSRFKKRYGKSLMVVATGGFVRHLKPYIRQVDRFDPRLSIKSLLRLYRETGKARNF